MVCANQIVYPNVRTCLEENKRTCTVLNVMDTAKVLHAQRYANNDVSKSTYSYSKYLKKKKNPNEDAL